MIDVEAFLKHYGVKGQKWGVRKHRNEAARKAKFAKGPKYQKEARRLDDEVLKARIKRMELEKRYTDLNAPQKSEGKKYASEILKNSGKAASGTVVGTTVSFAVARALKAKFGGN